MEKLNNQRNNLHASLYLDEKWYKEREDEKNKLIMQKTLKATELANLE
jgi:hypothetical protein